MKWIKRLRLKVDEMGRSGVYAQTPEAIPANSLHRWALSSMFHRFIFSLSRTCCSASLTFLLRRQRVCDDRCRFAGVSSPCDVRPVRAGAVPTTHVSCLASTGTTRPGSIHRAVSEPSCRSIAVTNIQLQSCNRGTEVTTGSFLPLATAGVNVSYDSMNYRGTSPRAFSTHRTSSISRLRHAHTTSSNDAMRYSSFTSLPV